MIHHPATQSLVLPLLLALIGIALLRAVLGARHAAWGGLLGLLGALAWLPGFDAAPGTSTHKLPWIALAALALAGLEAVRPDGRGRALLPGLAAAAGWAAAAAWLAAGRAGLPSLGVAVAFGAVVLALLAFDPDDGPAAAGAPADPAATGVLPASALVLASLGLAGLAGAGSSLLLAQLAAMLASSLAVVCVWALLRPASGLRPSPALRLGFGLAWLSIAWSWVLSAPVTGAATALSAVDGAGAARIAALAVALAVPVLLARRHLPGRASGWRSAITLALAAVPVALALAWPGASGLAPMPDRAAEPDDLYLTPSWQ